MVSALEAVLRLKEQEMAREKQASDNTTQAMELLQRAIQSNKANQLAFIQNADRAKQQQIENNRRVAEDANQALLRDAQIKALTAQANAFDSQGTGITGLDPSMLQSAGIFPEDIQMTPKQVSYKGQQKTILAPELKKQVSQKETADLGGIDSTISDLQKNVETLNKYKIQSGPGYATSSLPGADIYSQFTKSKEFNTWKADTGRAFQKYRKWATGVAAGYPELKLLAPNFPKSSDTHDVYVAKSESVINDMNRNKEIILDYLNKSGYRTGALRGNNTNNNTNNLKSKYGLE